LARHEKDFRTDAGEPLGPGDLRSLLDGGCHQPTRSSALAWYLSASDGWMLAGGLLGGAFAEDETRLRERKED